MLIAIFIGLIIIIINVAVQAFSTVYFFRFFIPQYQRQMNQSKTIYPTIWMLVYLVSFLTLLHASQCTLWAICYYFNPYISDLISFEQAIYFSLITFTTIGYGDITINSEWRIMAGLEAVNGIMLIGWSTAMIFAFLQILYKQSWNTHGFDLNSLHSVNSKEKIDIKGRNDLDNTAKRCSNE